MTTHDDRQPAAEWPWGLCTCRCGPAAHQTIILRPICIDPGNRVLFEGTLGACADCDCDLYRCAQHVEATRA